MASETNGGEARPHVQIGAAASAPPKCDVCNMVMPAIREGGIECHHDGTYTPLTAPTVMAELEELRQWREVGAELMRTSLFAMYGDPTWGARVARLLAPEMGSPEA